MRTGKLFVVSAPSGAGKTTLCNKLLEEHDTVAYSVSYTTRPPRFDETDGVDYYFVDEKAFERKIEDGDFIEWAKVHGNYYGTARSVIEGVLASGRDVLLDIDPQGARQLRGSYGHGVYIFIIAPSIDDLESRLRARRTETEEKMKVRLENARTEVQYYKDYDYLIVNREFETAYADLVCIYCAEHLRAADIPAITKIMDGV